LSGDAKEEVVVEELAGYSVCWRNASGIITVATATAAVNLIGD